MPITWLNKSRSALALSFFFPWFPPVPVSLPTEPPAAVKEAVAPAPEEPLVLPGVVIEEIPKGSALEKAGLQVGDVILSWERLPNPPANPEGARGEVGSYFDWVELEVEQAPRGAVVLRGQRSGESLELGVAPGVWDAKVRPVFSGVLEESYLSGEAELASGDIEAAVRTWEEIFEKTSSGDGRDVPTWVVLKIGSAWAVAADWLKSASILRERLDAVESRSSRVALLNAVGRAHYMRTEYESAENAFTEEFKIREEISSESLGLARSLHSLAEVAYGRGLLDRARESSLRALHIQEKLAPGSLDVAKSLRELGTQAWARGDLSSALSYDLRSLEIVEQLAPESPEFASNLDNLGVLAYERGDLGGAQEYFSRALALYEPESLGLAVTLNNLGAVALERWDLDRANDYLIRALRIWEKFAPQSSDVSITLNNLGVLSSARNDHARAHRYLLRALEIEEKISPQSLAVASGLSNLGVIASEEWSLDLANEYHLRALEIFEQRAPQGLLVANSLYNLGCVAEKLDRLESARAYYLHAMSIQEQLAPESLDLASSLAGVAMIAKRQGDLATAHAYYLRALQISERLAPRGFISAMYLSHLGSVYEDLGEAGCAQEYYFQILQAVEDQLSRGGGSYRMQGDFLTQSRIYFIRAMNIFIDYRQVPEALHVLERYRAQNFLAMLAERDSVFAADVPETLDQERRQLGTLYDRALRRLSHVDSQDHKEIESIRLELQKLDNEAEDIESRVRQASPRLAALRYSKSLDAVEIRKALDPGTLLLSYSLGDRETVLFAVSSSGDLELAIIPAGEEALRSRVKQFLDLISEARLGSSAVSSIGEQRRLQLQNASRELYSALLGPVAERIAQSHRLLILPDGPLHVLPFGALMRDDGAGGQYLAEWKPIHIALSATVFAELKQRRRPAGDSVSIQLAAFGDPVYPQSLTKADRFSGDPIVRSAAERGIFDWQPLPYTRHEVEGIARLFPEGSARTFLGPEALEEKIKSLDPKTRILHLAAHGYTDEHLPSSSFVALTIPEDTKPDDTRDNGLLQVWEIFERVRIDADLVVLSACDTGLGKELGGEGLIGLTRAFQYAGARTVMASLWSIQDRATAELMIRFYKHLRAGLPKDEALRQAQIELIRGPIEVLDEKGEKILFDASAPYYWAGIQVYGDWQ